MSHNFSKVAFQALGKIINSTSGKLKPSYQLIKCFNLQRVELTLVLGDTCVI